jgi:hypothetical protein
MREEKRGLLSPQILSLLWDPPEAGVVKAWEDKLGHMAVGTGQDQSGALEEEPFLSFKSPSIFCPCHHNHTIVFKAFLKPRRRMSCQCLPYVYVGELGRMIWCPCHYLIDLMNRFSI